MAYNKEMGITPETIKSSIMDILSSIYESDYWTVPAVKEGQAEYVSDAELKRLEEEMKAAAKKLDFEKAARIRDRIKTIKQEMLTAGIKG